MATTENQRFQNIHNSFYHEAVIALQSGLSAGLCLGFPAGIIFWLVLINNLTRSVVVTKLLNLFVDHIEPSEIALFLGTVSWGYLLSRIVDCRHRSQLALAITAGVFIGQLPMLNGKLDVMIQRFGFPVHIRFGLVLGFAVLSVMVCAGIALGFVLRNWKAAWILAGSSGFTSVLGTMTVFLLMDHFGIRVGSGDYAMLKVAVAGILTAAIIGGATLGVGFGRYVRLIE